MRIRTVRRARPIPLKYAALARRTARQFVEFIYLFFFNSLRGENSSRIAIFIRRIPARVKNPRNAIASRSGDSRPVSCSYNTSSSRLNRMDGGVCVCLCTYILALYLFSSSCSSPRHKAALYIYIHHRLFYKGKNFFGSVSFLFGGRDSQRTTAQGPSSSLQTVHQTSKTKKASTSIPVSAGAVE